VRQRRSDAVISTWTRTSGCGPRTRRDRPGKCSPARPGPSPVGVSSASPDAIIAALREQPVGLCQRLLRRKASRRSSPPCGDPPTGTRSARCVRRKPPRRRSRSSSRTMPLCQVVRGELRDHHLLYATRADFLRRLGRNSEAANAHQKALKRAHTDVERRSPNRRTQDVKAHTNRRRAM
jgi:hypothetical protein